MNKPMRAITNVGGYSAVFLPGGSPSFVLKSSKSIPKVISLQGVGVRGMSSFHTSGCDRGFIYTDVKGVTRVAQLPDNTNLTELGLAVRKMPLNEDIHAVAYHPSMSCYVTGTSTRTVFELPKDEDNRKEMKNEDIPFKPTTEQGFLKLINPVNWSVIDTIEMDSCESIMCVKSLNLEISETTNERKQLITVGTAISKGEDIPIKGRLYVYDVVTVVPQPGRPETNKRLKLIAKEEIPRGAITGVSEVGTQGFMLVAQGQKCMVRGLKEDGTLLPVAFMDMNCFVTAVKELPGTGLCVLSDAIKGVWFVGYTEEPYKMLLFGKSSTKMEVMTADLLPDGNELFIVAADVDCNLHIMQFDPERMSQLLGTPLHLLTSTKIRSPSRATSSSIVQPYP
jgi:cleavage and polyadenylation specificity factor subunit 1